MKMLISILAMTLMTVANASEVKILEVATSAYKTQLSSEFKINKDLGRAWVSISAEDGYDVDSIATEHRALVSALSFDAASQAVVFDNEGQLVECAKLVRKGFPIKYNRLVKTGRCEIKTQLVKRNVDNGYEIKKATVLEAYLVVE